MNKTIIIRTIYLYLFSLVGLVLVIIAGVRFIDMGLKAWIFTAAEQSVNYRAMPPEPVFMSGKESAGAILECEEECGFTDGQKQSIERWLADYDAWQNQEKNIDYIKQDRQRTAANSLAMLIIGAPLYAYHWRLASRRKKEEEENK